MNAQPDNSQYYIDLFETLVEKPAYCVIWLDNPSTFAPQFIDINPMALEMLTQDNPLSRRRMYLECDRQDIDSLLSSLERHGIDISQLTHPHILYEKGLEPTSISTRYPNRFACVVSTTNQCMLNFITHASGSHRIRVDLMEYSRLNASSL